MRTTMTPETLVVDASRVPGWAQGAEAVQTDRADYEVWEMRKGGVVIGYAYDDGDGYEFAEGLHNEPAVDWEWIYAQFADREREMAYGSETSLRGYCIESLQRDPSRRNVEWWTRAYDLYEADQAKPESERYEDLQDLFDAVEV